MAIGPVPRVTPLLVCLAALSCTRTAREREGDLRRVGIEVLVDTRPSCATRDRVRVRGLEVDTTGVREGQIVQLVLGIQNRCPRGSAGYHVPWSLQLDRALLHEGTAWVEAGDAVDIRRTWRAVTGPHRIEATANLPDRLGENDLANNGAVVDLAVSPGLATPAIPPPETPAPSLAQRFLTHAEAVDHGAGFAHNVDPGSTCRSIGYYQLGRPGLYEEFPEAAAIFIANCDIWGGTASPEALLELRLQNGWRVKSDSTHFMFGSPEQWRWEVRPGERSPDEPYMRGRIFSDAIHTAAVVVVFVVVEGPEGTSPF